MNDSTFMLPVSSKCTALVTLHVKSATYTFLVLLPSFTYNGAVKSMPVFANGLLILTLMLEVYQVQLFQKVGLYRVSHEKGIDKLLFGTIQGFNLQFLNLFGLSVSVSFAWCII